MGSMPNSIREGGNCANWTPGDSVEERPQDYNAKRPAVGMAEEKGRKRCRSSSVDSIPDDESDKLTSKDDVEPLAEGISTYTDMDVLSGRGGGTNLHPGNRHYRALILSHRGVYDNASKTAKPTVARNVVQMIRDRGGRFLRKEKSDGLFYDIGDVAAREKTSQALRHRTFEMRLKAECTKDKGTAQPLPAQQHGSCASDASLSPKGAQHGNGRSLVSLDAQLHKGIDMSNTTAEGMLWNYNHRSDPFYQGLVSRQLYAPPTLRDLPTSNFMQSIAELRQQRALLDLDASLRSAEMRPHATSLPLGMNPDILLGSRAPLPLGLPLQQDQALYLHLADRIGRTPPQRMASPYLPSSSQRSLNNISFSTFFTEESNRQNQR